MPSAEEIRAGQRATWAGLSAGWEKWDAVITDQLAPVGTAMIERLEVTPDHRYLDIASGTGEPGLSVAKLVPTGHVVLTDLVPEMLAVAERRAQAAGVTNVETQVCSADDLPFDDATFDGVSVRFGYMFFPDVARGDRRVRAGARAGRTALLVGVDRARGEPVDRDRHGRRSPPRWPWRLPTRMRRACSGARRREPSRRRYEDAGLRDVAEWSVEVELVTQSPEEYWAMISEHVSLAVAALRAGRRTGAGAHRCPGRRERAGVRAGRRDPGAGPGAVHRGDEAAGTTLTQRGARDERVQRSSRLMSVQSVTLVLAGVASPSQSRCTTAGV